MLRTISLLLGAALLGQGSAFAQGNANKESLIDAFKKERQILSGAEFAPQVPSPEDLLRFSPSITPGDLEAHLGFIASDELEGRETAERGQKLAAQYLIAQFKKLGLQPGNGDSWVQEYELTRNRVESVELSFDGKSYSPFAKDFFFLNRAGFEKDMTLPLAFAGHGIAHPKYNNLEGLDLKGKAVVILEGEPKANGESVIPKAAGEDRIGLAKVTEYLLEAEAAAIIAVVPDENFNRYSKSPWLKHMMDGAGLSLKYLEKPALPTLFISESKFNALAKKSKTNAEDLKKELAQNSQVSPINFGKYQLDMKIEGQKEVVIAENVLGFLEGTDKKDEIIVLTAHYDHLGVRDGEVFNGADDDGTGTVALIEIAEAFVKASEAGFRPRRSILFMPVSGEEKGLLGSRYYSDHPVYPLASTVCNLNVDMIGRIDEFHENGKYIYVIGSDMLSTDLHQANEKANQLLGTIKLDYRYNDKDDPNRYYYRSDHYNFAKNNVPCIFYFSGVHEDYHKATDTIEKIDFQKSADVTQLIFATAWVVANQEKRLVVDKAK